MPPDTPEYIREMHESGYLSMLPMLCAMATIELSDAYLRRKDWTMPTDALFHDPKHADLWLEATAYIITPRTLEKGSAEDRLHRVVDWLTDGDRRYMKIIKELMQ